ncbi:MAG: hypothetical protein IPF64_17605 [Flavobacteriales bacterium]|nr:hypothetical protein [Flavobacteriales bacterium]
MTCSCSKEQAANGIELWVTDGTLAGTVMLRTFTPVRAAAVPRKFILYNGLVYFSAIAPELGEEPWVSDGTEAGTVLVMDIKPGTARLAEILRRGERPALLPGYGPWGQ